MKLLNRMEVRLALLMVLVALLTSALTFWMNDVQRARAFKDLPQDVREYLGPRSNQLPLFGLPHELREAIGSGKTILVKVELSDQSSILYSTEGDKFVRLALAAPRDNRNRTRGFEGRLQQNLLVASLLSAFIGAVLALFFARRIARPIERVSEAANRVAKGDLKVRLAVTKGQSETEILARDFNHMADSLERLESERKDMIADIAHELRTPLTVMQGRLEAIQDKVISLDDSEVDRLHKQTLLLGRLVEDLRTISLVDSGKLSLEFTRVNLSNLVESVSNFQSPQAHAKNIKINSDVEKDLSQNLDAVRITQVLNNLLANAIAYTPENGEVGIRIHAADGGSEVVVWDNGHGIPEESLPRIFDRFYRAEASRSRSSGGSGLGLTIAKSLIELHHGKISAKNRPEGGAEFRVFLPSGIS